MSILHIFNVTDSWWKKSHWATSSVCLCHRISSTAAFSQMMRKLLSQLQHPLFFSPPPHPILVLPGPSPSPCSQWVRGARRRQRRAGPAGSLQKPARHCHRPARPRSAAASPSRPGDAGMPWKKNPPCSSGPAQHPGLTCPVTGAALRVWAGTGALRRGGGWCSLDVVLPELSQESTGKAQKVFKMGASKVSQPKKQDT